MTWAALALYLTLTGPAHTTMTVVWHTDARAEGSVVWYAAEPGGAWKRAIGKNHPLPHSTRRVHVGPTSPLDPGTRVDIADLVLGWSDRGPLKMNRG